MAYKVTIQDLRNMDINSGKTDITYTFDDGNGNGANGQASINFNSYTDAPSFLSQVESAIQSDAAGRGWTISSIIWGIDKTRVTSTQSLSLVGTGATGTQISATKDSTVRFNVSTSTTSTIGGASTSLVTLKKCATNDSTEGNWTAVAVLENDQTITLAIALQSIQVIKGQLETDLPAGWYVKLVNSGSGTHSEAFISGEKTIYG